MKYLVPVIEKSKFPDSSKNSQRVSPMAISSDVVAPLGMLTTLSFSPSTQLTFKIVALLDIN